MKKKELDKELDFEQAMQMLEKIVQQLETGDLSLDNSLQLYEEGIQLANQCQKSLTQAEQKVAVLSQMGTENESLQPLDKDFDE